MRSLFEYGQLPRLDDATREKHEDDIVQMMLNDKEKYHSEIEEMIEYFIAEMGNSDFIRLAEKIKEKRII